MAGNKRHPYNLDEPNHIDRVTSRIAGLIGGGVAGLAIAILCMVVLTKLGSDSLDHAFFGIIGSIIAFAIIGAVWPKWFAWILDLLTFW